MNASAKASAVVAAVFIVGFLAGIGGSACFLAVRGQLPGWHPGRPEQAFSLQGPTARMERMARELDLTPAQREQLRPILVATKEKFQAMRSKHRPEMRVILDETRSEIRAILTEPQQKRFDVLSEKMHRRFEHRMDRMGRGPFGSTDSGRGRAQERGACWK